MAFNQSFGLGIIREPDRKALQFRIKIHRNIKGIMGVVHQNLFSLKWGFHRVIKTEGVFHFRAAKAAFFKTAKTAIAAKAPVATEAAIAFVLGAVFGFKIRIGLGINRLDINIRQHWDIRWANRFIKRRGVRHQLFNILRQSLLIPTFNPNRCQQHAHNGEGSNFGLSQINLGIGHGVTRHKIFIHPIEHIQ